MIAGENAVSEASFLIAEIVTPQIDQPSSGGFDPLLVRVKNISRQVVMLSVTHTPQTDTDCIFTLNVHPVYELSNVLLESSW